MDNGASSYRRFLDGDESGITEIVRDYKDGLIFYLYSMVHDMHLAEDLAEDTFVQLLIKRPRDHGTGSFKTWLYTIGRNIALNHLRRERKAVTVSTEEWEPSTGDEDGLERAYLREEQKIQVYRAMQRLKPEYRQVLWLIYFEDFSCRDAAKVMKKSVHSIETLVYRARMSLKSELDKEGFEYEKL